MEMALAFNDTTFTPVTRQNSLWIRAVELSQALGYKREDSVAKIYRANADEFTPDMAQVVEIIDNAESAFPVKSLLFSLRGCHLLAMFARTPVAKAFRVWVLDVLDKLAEEERATEPASNPDKLPAVSLSVTPSTVADRKPLRSLVNAWARVSGHPFDACWSQLKAAFSLTDIRDLPQEWIPDAVAWVQSKIDALPKALPATPVAPSAPAVVEDRRIPDALAEMRKLISHCGMVRNTVQVECHPGVVSMSMSAQEREAYYALQAMYQTAVDNMYTAAHALDACLKLRAMYPAHR